MCQKYRVKQGDAVMVNYQNQGAIVKNIYFDTVELIDDKHTVDSILDYLAKRAAAMIGYSPELLVKRINSAKQQSSSAIGGGLALPHMQVRGLNGPITILVRLKYPIHFENTPDNKPVDLVCLMLSPLRVGPLHLLRLSKLTRMLKDEAITDLMRDTDDPMVLMNILNNPDGWVLAA
jgi:PTS system nitrogen regulatory IIA component